MFSLMTGFTERENVHPVLSFISHIMVIFRCLAPANFTLKVSCWGKLPTVNSLVEICSGEILLSVSVLPHSFLCSLAFFCLSIFALSRFCFLFASFCFRPFLGSDSFTYFALMSVSAIVSFIFSKFRDRLRSIFMRTAAFVTYFHFHFFLQKRSLRQANGIVAQTIHRLAHWRHKNEIRPSVLYCLSNSII